jgi:hypothetical protein
MTGCSGSQAVADDALLTAHSVEKLLGVIARRVFLGPPTINQVAIVDPGPF